MEEKRPASAEKPRLAGFFLADLIPEQPAWGNLSASP